MELLAPDQIYRAWRQKSLVYVPLGAIEWHGLHLPIGLDGLTAHGICLRAAARAGGLVMPPLYYGMTGSIGHHPLTILVEDEHEFLAILRTTLARLEDFEVETAVVFSGHFGRRQLAALQRLQEEWDREAHRMTLKTLSISQCPDIEMRGDHGAIFETSVLSQLRPDLVHIEKLPSQEATPANDPGGDSWGDHRRDPSNVLFGILGDDPRDYNDAEAKVLLEKLITWVCREVAAA